MALTSIQNEGHSWSEQYTKREHDRGYNQLAVFFFLGGRYSRIYAGVKFSDRAVLNEHPMPNYPSAQDCKVVAALCAVRGAKEECHANAVTGKRGLNYFLLNYW